MDFDIKELVKIATENLNLKEFKGDVVAVKVVENEMHVEDGGIAVQNNYYGSSPVGKKVSTADDMVLENNIFNNKLFDSNAKLVRLRDEIGARIEGARLVDESRFAADRPQIDPKVQKEWYYIWKPLNESGLFSGNKVNMTMFAEQMLKWYPEMFPTFTDEKEQADYSNRLMKSISAEKSKWEKDGPEVKIEDMAASCQRQNLVLAKMQPMIFVCIDLTKGLKNNYK